MRSSAGASILAVVPALVNLTSLPRVAWLAATLCHLTGIEETAPAVLTLNITGPKRRSWGGGEISSELIFSMEYLSLKSPRSLRKLNKGCISSSTAQLSLYICALYLQTYRMVTGWEPVSLHMCHCQPCIYWGRYTQVHWGWAGTATHTSSCRMGWSLSHRKNYDKTKRMRLANFKSLFC